MMPNFILLCFVAVVFSVSGALAQNAPPTTQAVSVTALDLSILFVFLVSGLLGACRGFLRVMLVTFCCSCSYYVAIRFGVPQDPLAPSVIGKTLLLMAALFGSTLLVMLAIAARLSHKVLSNRIGGFDRIFGLFVGLIRGLIVGAVSFMFFSWFVPAGKFPEWVKDARSLEVLNKTGDWLLALSSQRNDDDYVIQFFFGSLFGMICNGFLLSVVVDFFAVMAKSFQRRGTVTERQ